MRPPQRQSGFTLLELIVGMGLLAALLIVLVNLMAGGMEMFAAGERGQALSDRVHTASRATEQALQRCVGPTRLSLVEEALPEARLLAYGVTLGLGERAERGRSQLLRSTVEFDRVEERALQAEWLRPLVALEVGTQDESLLREKLDEMVALQPLMGRGEMLLLPWPVDPAGVYLELRQALWSSDPELLPEGLVPLREVEDLDAMELDPEWIEQDSRVVATGLLHCEIEFWTQTTQGWANAGRDGPCRSWDSARAGLLYDDERPEEAFPLDTGADSLRDGRDDVWPRWIRVTLVVGDGPNALPEAVLARSIGADDRELWVNRIDRLPRLDGDPWLKVGSEWLRVRAAEGTRLGGLERAGRGSKPQAHPAGTAVRAGRTVQLVLRLPQGRDSDV